LLRTALGNIHVKNPQLIDFTSTLCHTKKPSKFDVNPLRVMMHDTQQWKQLIKAKVAEKSSGTLDVQTTGKKRVFSARVEIKSRNMHSVTTGAYIGNKC